MALENRLKEARKVAKLTQEQAAAAIGVAKSTWAGYESGNSQPDIAKLVKIMETLRVDANFLWQDYFPETEKAPASQQEPLISLDALTDLLKRLGFIRDSNDITEEDLAFLRNIFGVLESWFSRKRG